MLGTRESLASSETIAKQACSATDFLLLRDIRIAACTLPFVPLSQITPYVKLKRRPQKLISCEAALGQYCCIALTARHCAEGPQTAITVLARRSLLRILLPVPRPFPSAAKGMDSAVLLNQIGLGTEGSGPIVYEITSDDSETQIDGLEQDRGLFTAYHYAQRFKVQSLRAVLLTLRICNVARTSCPHCNGNEVKGCIATVRC